MSKRKDIIRRGDVVKVIEPKLFVRCGYPLSKNMARKLAREKLSKIDRAVLVDIGLCTPSENVLDMEYKGEFDHRLIDLVAESILSKEKYGGKERSIFTIDIPEIKDMFFRVHDFRMVNTGIYCPASGGYDYYGGGEDYDPPYLNDVKAHKILTIYRKPLEFTGNSNWSEVYSIDLESILYKLLDDSKCVGFDIQDVRKYSKYHMYEIEANNCLKISTEEQEWNAEKRLRVIV